MIEKQYLWKMMTEKHSVIKIMGCGTMKWMIIVGYKKRKICHFTLSLRLCESRLVYSSSAWIIPSLFKFIYSVRSKIHIHELQPQIWATPYIE